MKPLKLIAGMALALSLFSASAHAEGELNIYNWGNYTSPDLIKKFEEAYKVKVTVTDYDSNDAALAKIRAGGHGFDMAVPSANFMQIWIKEGLAMESRPDQMENFKNIDPRWVNVEWDPGRHYSVPWQWGVTGVVVDTSKYSGDINTAGIILDTPKELVGKTNVVPEMNDVMFLAIKAQGGKWCTDDKALLKQVRDKLVAAKPNWIAMDYGTIEKFASGDYWASYVWNGAGMRAREANPKVAFGYPKEGFPIFMDSMVILKDAKNVDNAKLFMNFIMAPENAALISNFAKYANGVKGSEQFMDPAMKDAPELKMPDTGGEFMTPCAPEVNEIYTKIWTDLLK